jgi:Type II secretion system (T2SS), protein E, N-terminal domain
MDSSIGIQAFEWVARLASKLSPGALSRQSESIDKVLWSAPQGFQYMRPLKKEEDVDGAEVRFLDGQQVHGWLERFNPSGISLKLRLKLNGQVLHLAHAQIKRVTLAEPMAMIEEPGAHSAAMAVGVVADFHVQFIDGEIWQGETKGSINTPSGVFLFPMVGDHPKHVGTSRQNVARHFVPRAAIRSVRIGAPSVISPTRGMTPVSTPIEYKPNSTAPRMLDPENPEALEIICRGQTTKIEGLKLGDALMQLGIVTREEVQSAVAMQARKNDGRRIGAILMEMKQLKEETIQQALLHRLGVPFVKLGRLNAKSETVARIDRGECLSKACAVLHENSSTAYLAMANPLDDECIKAYRFRLQKKIEVVMADRADIAAFLLRHRIEAAAGFGHEFFFA